MRIACEEKIVSAEISVFGFFFLVRQMGKILFRKMFVILDFAGRTANVTNRCENHQKKSMR